MALTKAKIVESMQANLGLPRKRCTELLEKLIDIIKANLENGESVMISGFGKFCVNKKKERKGRNPATGSDMLLDKRKVVTFKCSHILREKINGS
ncbi:MAG: integration host factor subunit alpha [Desulfobacterales bacterium]|nr:integration host factor subunit alpha [Desulfobacterales bacterium]